MKCGAHLVRTHTETAASVVGRRGVKQGFLEKFGLNQLLDPQFGYEAFA